MDNYEFLNSSPETQFELMNTMLQLEQLTRSQYHSDSTVHPSLSDFSSGSSTLSPTNTQFHNFTFQNQCMQSFCTNENAMREMIYQVAAMQPVNIDPETVKPPKRRNVRISNEPQSVAARLRREKISERIRILQRLVPGGTKMDTASMLDEAIHYVKFLKSQIQSLERVQVAQSQMHGTGTLGFGSGTSVNPSYDDKQDLRFMRF